MLTFEGDLSLILSVPVSRASLSYVENYGCVRGAA